MDSRSRGDWKMMNRYMESRRGNKEMIGGRKNKWQENGGRVEKDDGKIQRTGKESGGEKNGMRTRNKTQVSDRKRLNSIETLKTLRTTFLSSWIWKLQIFCKAESKLTTTKTASIVSSDSSLFLLTSSVRANKWRYFYIHLETHLHIYRPTHTHVCNICLYKYIYNIIHAQIPRNIHI